MGRIIIVRHGQASYGEADYDQLSARGVRQCELLGAYWAGRGLHVDQVIVGPRRRHKQSHEAALRGAGSKSDWPDPMEDAALDEYQAFEVMDHYAPNHKDLLINTDEGRRQYFLLYRQTMRQWINNGASSPGIESWQAFRQRVAGSAERLRTAALDKTVLAFTSGGPTAAVIGHVLGLDDLRTMELSWSVSNGSFSEVLVQRTSDEERFSLLSFNAVPHISDPDLLTGA